jgi:hypothetical protein
VAETPDQSGVRVGEGSESERPVSMSELMMAEKLRLVLSGESVL